MFGHCWRRINVGLPQLNVENFIGSLNQKNLKLKERIRRKKHSLIGE